MFFCQECGAAITDDAEVCFACHQPLDRSDEYDGQSIALMYEATPVFSALPIPAGPLQAGSLLHGRYHILGEVGQGGYGVVYKASDSKLKNKLVAVKQINLATLTTRQKIEATDSYNREVHILSKLRHDNLPRIYDHFTDPDHWYLVMDYIEGETLEDYLQKKPGGHLSLREARQIGIQLTKVLHYLHQQQPAIIFRDVKPANVMRTANGHLYLVDFGIARLYNPEKKRDTGPLGSPGYAAPEQYGLAQSTIRTDIYGLGATLQTLLLGEATADGATALPAPALPRSLQKLLDQMLEREASKRPRHMQEVQHRLETTFTGIASMSLRFLRTASWGLVIGSLPYSTLWFYQLFSPIPVVGQILGFFFFLLAIFMFSMWEVVLGAQALIALILLFSRRHYPIGIGILVMMGGLLLAQVFGWLPWIGLYSQSTSFPFFAFPPFH